MHWTSEVALAGAVYERLAILEQDDWPATAGMDISVQGILLRALVFFSGQSELMGHVLSGTASDPISAYQGTTLSHNHEHYVILSSGATVLMRLLGAQSIDLNGSGMEMEMNLAFGIATQMQKLRKVRALLYLATRLLDLLTHKSAGFTLALNQKNNEIFLGAGIVLSGSYRVNFFTKFFEKDEEEELITMIKRCLLCIQKEEYKKAEQMLHLALRTTQDLQSKEGITYVFDVMANLAMEQGHYDKAEQLFSEVMKRLFADGETDDSTKILHISFKIAHMAQLRGQINKAVQGFTWTLRKLEENVKKNPNDKDIRELLGLTKNWFGQLQITRNMYTEAKTLLSEAYECYVQLYGTVNEEAATILNNLSVVCVHVNDFNEAKRYSLKAIEVAKELKDTNQEGILLANLGLIYLKEGIVAKAKEVCSQAWKLGVRDNNFDAIEQAEYCLNEIKQFNKS